MDRRRVDKKKKNRIRFERLMAHVGYGICVITFWGFVFWMVRILKDIFLG